MERTHRPAGGAGVPLLPYSGTPISSRQATWLFIRRQEELTPDEKQTLARLSNQDTEVDVAYEMVQQFAQMMRDRTGEEQLDGWLEQVESLPLIALHPLVVGTYQD